MKRLRWAVLGVGIAGRARARAIHSDPRSQLVAVHRGRFAAEAGAPELPLAEAIEAADAVAICSPSALHPQQVRQVLAAGRHAVVEFPLAPTAAEAAALLEEASNRGRILHVEHIELLDGAQRLLHAQTRDTSLRSMRLSFARRGPAAFDASAAAASLLSGLHRLVHLGGPVHEVRGARLQDGRFEAELLLQGPGGAPLPVSLDFIQSPTLARQTRLTVESDANRWVLENRTLSRDGAPQPLPEALPLFAQDHHHAMERILDGAAPYVTDRRILHVLQTIEALAGAATEPDPASARQGLRPEGPR